MSFQRLHWDAAASADRVVLVLRKIYFSHDLLQLVQGQGFVQFNVQFLLHSLVLFPAFQR